MEIFGFSLTFWLIWILINVGPAWYVIYKKRRYVRPAAANDPKYKPFHAVDDPYKNYSYLFAVVTHFFFIPRFVIGWCCFLFIPLLSFFFCLGEKDTTKLPRWKVAMLEKIGQWGCWASIVLCGIVF
jgi:hypothetical protein